MPRSSCLTLIVPDLLASEIQASQGQVAESVLARIAGRGERVRRWDAGRPEEARQRAWQRALLATLQLDQRSSPSAALTALGMNLEPGQKQWFQAEAIHLAAGLNEVTLVPLRGAAALTAEEVAGLTLALNEHLASSGFVIHRTVANDWLLETSDAWDVRTVVAEFAISHEWEEALPQGADAGRLRRLMTELQMLLHDHPVNHRRSARGMPTANAVWFWGNGYIEKNTERQRAACVGRSDYFRGLCQAHEWEHCDDVSPAMLVARCSDMPLVVAVVAVSSLSELESQWLSPVLDGLRQGRYSRLQLILDAWEINIDRWRLKAFWRRDIPVAEWARA